jgi:hypothetical protein
VPVSSSPELLVLLALRLTGLAEPEAIADRTALAPEVVTALLDEAAARGEVRYRSGSFHGWALTPVGRDRSGALFAAELDTHGLGAAFDDAYQRFLPHNTELLALCTSWQLRDRGGQPTVNEHDDPAYDQSCIARLGELDDKVEPLVADLADLAERFAGYGARLRAARDHVEAGEGDWFTSPGVDSYHTVWFELHEHLLATLGLERTDERNDS